MGCGVHKLFWGQVEERRLRSFLSEGRQDSLRQERLSNPEDPESAEGHKREVEAKEGSRFLANTPSPWTPKSSSHQLPGRSWVRVLL